MEKIKFFLPFILLSGLLFGSCAQAPAEPAQAAVPETSSAAPSYDWREALPSPSVELQLAPFYMELDQSEPVAEIKTERQITLPGGEKLCLSFSGFAGSDVSPARQKLCDLRSVAVWEGDTLLQVITFDAPYFQSDEGRLWSRAEEFGITVEDMNFDGALDFSVKNVLSSEKASIFNLFEFHFLWDDGHLCFMPAPALDVLPNPIFDAESQTVTSAYTDARGDWQTESAHEKLYRYVNGELKCVRRKETVLDKDQWLLTTRTAEWDGTIWVEIPPETEPAYREQTHIAELKEGVWVKLTAWGLRREPLPDAEDYKSGWLRQIDVFTASPEATGAPPIQTIYCNPLVFPVNLDTSDCFQASFPDYNFDGCPDLRFFSGSGTGGFFYTCYLWSPRLGRFVKNETLSGYGDPMPNTVTGEIDCIEKLGYMGWVKIALRWQGEDFVPVRKNYYEYVLDPENPEDETPPVCHTVLIYKGGEWVLVSEEILADGNFELR